MRADSPTSVLDVDPGVTAEVVVDVVNTSAVIDGVTTRVIGWPVELVTAEPALLPLFPESGGQVRLAVAVPPTYPAGSHPVTVEVVSHGARAATEFVDLTVSVAPSAHLRAAATPRVVRTRRRGRFVVELVNSGNVAVTVALDATDVDRATTVTVNPERVVVPPGVTTAVIVALRGPRLLFGSEVDRVVTVGVRAAAVPLPDADPDTPAEVLEVAPLTLRLRQRPAIGRGLLTVLILASIVALWALAVLFGLDRVFAGDPLTKQAPASFFAASPAAAGAAGSGGAAAAGGAGSAAPAGALPKNGSVPAGVGGTISGTVTATSNRGPVGRIVVEALRETRTGLQTVSAAATQSDGSFSIAGLFPTSYLVRATAPGYTVTWYPGGAAQTDAKSVSVASMATAGGVDLVVNGDPATVSGTVNVGETTGRVVATVTARPLQAGTETQAPVTTTTDAAGAYTLANLPAPSTYEITFTAPGYQPTSITDSVGGGQQRIEPGVTLSVTSGVISGTVTDGTRPLGGATVTTTVNGQSRSVVTPTDGQVGTFAFSDLATPQSYVVTVTKQGYGTQSVVIDLAGGASRAGLALAIASGTGSVSGRLLGPDGNGVGGATVTVGGTTTSGGSATTPTTTTLTTGTVGAFAIGGLPAPGSYTLTFTAPGYAPTTVPVTLAANAPPATVTASLTTSNGGVAGTVQDSAGRALAGATVSVTSGAATATTTTTNTGSYLVRGLAPGTYSVTASATGYTSRTALVTVTTGANVQVPTLALGS